MPGLEGRQLFSSVQPGIEARLHASFSSFDGLEWEIRSPSQPLMSLYVDLFIVDNKSIKPPVVPGLVAYDGPCSQKDQILTENSRIFSATRGATCLSIPATKNKKRASNLYLLVMVLAAALMPGLEGRQLFSSVQPGIEARLNASFSSFDGLEWEIRCPSQSLLSLYVERFIVDNKLTKPTVVPGLVAYDGPCSQKDQKLPENTRIFLATRGVMCLSIPATMNKKRARNLFLSVMALGERRMDESFTEQNQIEPNIVGGRPISSIRRWPWMVSLQYLADHICGGVIIGRRWVVTAAHCLRNSFKPYPNLSVKAGTVDLYSYTATQIAIEKVIIHPGNFLQHYDDIALLKLKEPLRMSDSIQAIKLPQYDQKSYKRCFLTGWGKTSTYSYLSRYLKDIEMFIKKDSECNKRETILCADGEGSGCYGDSGGPLMCRDNEASSWKLVGILSHGQGCSKNAFTKVYSYLDWIHDTINLETSSDNDCSPENPGSCSPQRNIENAFPFSYKSSNDDLETGLSNTDSIMCSGHTTIDVTQPGTISSPGFQSYTPYPTNLDCQLNLKIPKNKVLSVQFFDFYLDGSKNCRFDRLEISESKNGRDYSVSKTLCGARRPDFLVIKGPNIKFRFVTSKLNFEAFTGFKLAYHIATEQGENKRIEQSCPKQLIIDGQSSGSITSPGFERGEYPPNQKCEYILRFPIEGRLKINFDVFSLEDECDYDAVTIFDPRNQYEIARFCGNNIPKDMILRGPAIGIRFESDEYAQFRGFRLFYSFHMIECGMRKSWNEQDSTKPTIKPESNVFSALKWPWMVSIQHPEGHYCGGSIIDEQWVLSSAKCFRNNSRKYSDFRVKAGAVDLDSTDATVVPVETITMYPGYRLKNPFDIALVKLKEPLKMSDSIQRICLPKQDRKSYKRCFSLGWPVKFPNQPRRPILTELELFIRKKEDYAKIIDYGWNFINDESCIKGDEIGCRVNTTGPLVCYNEASSKWRVVGIQTFRPGACDTTQQMLTKVFSYVDWIYDTMLGDSLNSIRETQEATSIVGLSNTDSIMCSGHSTIDVTQPGTVSSSGFQKNIPYPNNQDCVLYLRIPWKKVLSIQFLDFNLEESENCQFDRLEILESKNGKDYSFNKTLCGSKRPENLLIEGPIIKFHFVSDKYRQFSGFKFAYQLATQKGEINQIDQSCPKQLIIDVRSSGNITSPGFERGEYPPNKNCEYILRFPTDVRLKINFDVFSLEDECDYDAVTIFDPRNQYEIARFCGNNIPKDMILRGPAIGIRFESDEYAQFRGFRLFYSFHMIDEIKQIDQSCPKQLIIDVQSSGSITSPGFERGEYPPDKKCEYILRFPAEKRLKINFDVFSLEDECNYDSVTIFNPKTRNELGRFCGNNIPKDMSLTGPEVGVRFESDSFNQRRGFRLFYSLHTIECGVRDWTEDDQIEATIIKGRRVESTRKWPWMVSLHRKEDGYVCGGMIINEHWVLTAAHCVTRSLRNRLTLYVQAGTLERESDSQLIPVERVDCLHNNIIYRDDVALVKLKEPLKMSENIAPICITKTDQKSFKRCVVTGWGTFSRYSGFNRFLHEAEVQIESDQFCASSFQIYNYHPPSMVCAGGNESACYGDSGGPLMCYDESSLRWTAVGIVSFGKKCGEILYGAYQKVSYFANWIEQMISKDESDDSEMEIEKPRPFCHELWSYENDYADISKNGCNFDDSNLCNYYILENSNWKIQKNPQNSSDRYLVIYNKMKRPYQEVELWPPSFFLNSARCLSFKYKIEPVTGSLLSIIGEEIDISQDTVRKKSVWTSDSTAGWNKAQIVLSDSNFENFYFSMSIQAMASVAIDDISVNRWC